MPPDEACTIVNASSREDQASTSDSVRFGSVSLIQYSQTSLNFIPGRVRTDGYYIGTAAYVEPPTRYRSFESHRQAPADHDQVAARGPGSLGTRREGCVGFDPNHERTTEGAQAAQYLQSVEDLGEAFPSEEVVIDAGARHKRRF